MLAPDSTLILDVAAFDSPVALDLIAAIQQTYVERYGGPDETPLRPDEFTPPGGVFLVGRLAGEPIACGGWRTLAPGLGEIKRMFIVPAYRGRGLSRVLLAGLESSARDAGLERLCLETGHRQPEALGLYRSSGWETIEKYGLYRHEPGSSCFGKVLT